MTAEMLDQTETQQSNKHTPHLSPQLLKCFEDYALFPFVMSTWVYVTLQTCSKLKVAHYYYQAREALICHLV